MKPTLLLLCATLIIPSSLLAAQTIDSKPQQRTLSVNGEATVKIPATEAHLVVAIQAREKTAEAAQTAIAEKSNEVLAYLKEAKVSDLQTPGLSLQPLYQPSSSNKFYRPDEDRPVSGYQAQWTATFDVPIAQAGKVADAVVTHGATRIIAFQPKATDEAVMKAHRKALQEAAQNARDDADAVLATLGYKQKEIVQIRVENAGPIVPMVLHYSMAGARVGSAKSTAVEGGTQNVTGRVTLEVAY